MKKIVKTKFKYIFLLAVVLIGTFFVNTKTVFADKYQGLEIKNGVVLSYKGNKEKLVIPETINGITIKAIGEGAFENNSTIKNVEVPSTVETIGSNAFRGCSSLEKMVLGEEVTSIGAYAFYECKNLQDIQLSSNLKIIDTWTFGYCKKLERITLPEKLVEIGSASFYGCSSLKQIYMPNTVEKIGTHCFRDCHELSNIQFSDNIRVIPYRAFSSCLKLEEVIFPKQLTKIDKEAFYNCPKLKKIEMFNNISVIGEGAFYECKSLEAVAFPDSIKEIENEAFYGCVNIETIKMSNGLVGIGDRSFENCYKLISIVIPKNVKKIGEDAFENCHRIAEIYNLSSLKIQAGVSDSWKLGNRALCVHKNAEDASHIQIEKDYVFYKGEERSILLKYNSDTPTVILPITFNDKSYDIREYAFYNDLWLESVVIPEGIDNIKVNTFYGCANLHNVTLPKSIKIIGDNAFSQCNNLRRIEYKGESKEWDQILIGGNNEKLTKWNVFTSERSQNSSEYEQIEENQKLDITGFFESNIFVVNFLFTIVWGIIFLYSKHYNDTPQKQQKRKLWFVIVVCVQWILISGLRADTVGADTSNYIRLFETHNAMSWKDIFLSIKDYYTGVGAIVSDYEPGYILLEKFIGIFSQSPIVYQFVIATIFMAALGRYIYKYSDEPCLSFIIYDALFYNMFSLTGYRQVVSAAIGILLGYEMVRKRKVGTFLVLIVISSLFHKSTLIFLLFYFFANKKITKKYVLLMAGITSVMLVARRQLFDYVKILVGYEEYSGNYGFAQLTFTILLLALTIFSLYLKPQILRYKEEAIHYYNGLILMWMMMPFAMVSPTSMRLVYDFGFVLLLLIPTILKSFKIRNNRVILYFVIVLLFGYFIVTKTPNYQFYI